MITTADSAPKRFREFFVENHQSSVYLHPYTPQENGHIESFHAILAKIETVLLDTPGIGTDFGAFTKKYTITKDSSVCNLP
jgi:hypothetical protein